MRPTSSWRKTRSRTNGVQTWPRSRRVQAQRKFAQGAYVPPNVVAVAATNDNRRDAAHDARNVTINHMTPSGLIDVVSMQGIHNHLHAVVLVERLRGRTPIRDVPHHKETPQFPPREKTKVGNHKVVPPKLLHVRKKKEYKRSHVMSLRSRSDARKQQFKKSEVISRPTTRRSAVKRKVPIEPENPPKPKKKNTGVKDRRLEPSEFSLDDNRPLTYFAKCTTPKRSAPSVPLVKPGVSSSEPMPGPSGLQLSGTNSTLSGSYYNSEHNIHRWMNDSITPETRRTELEESDTVQSDPVTPKPVIPEPSIPEPSIPEPSIPEPSIPEPSIPEPECVAKKWRTVDDVVNVPEHELNSRCTKCTPCVRITTIIKLSAVVRTRLMPDLKYTERLPREVNDTETDAADSQDDDGKNVYLDLLPKQPNVMMNLRINSINDKEFFSVSLTDARKNKQEFLLQVKEHPLDKLLGSFLKSLNMKQEEETGAHEATISTRERDETDYGPIPPEKQGEYILNEERRILKHVNRAAAEVRLKDASDLKAKKAAEVSRIEAEKKAEAIRIEAEKKAEAIRIEAEKQAEIARIEAEKQVEISRIEAEKQVEISRIKTRLRAELEAEFRMMAEVDQQAKALENEKDAKRMDAGQSSEADANAPGTSGFPQSSEGGKLVDAPVFRPTEEEFTDPIAYFEKIWPEAFKYGICKVVPPEGWKPKCRVHDDIRFDVTNQYISRLFSRWGPAARELCAIKLCLQQQKVNFARPPLLDGVEVNLPKLYHLVQRQGGLENVINKKKWGKVAEEMKFNKTPTTERKLDQIYVKYLLPYDTLSHQERQDIVRKVEKAWNRKNQKILDRAMNPLHRQKRMLGLSDSSDDETEDEDTAIALNEAEDCIIRGVVMNRAKFKRVATNAYENVFGQGSEAHEPAPITHIEKQYWRNVLLGTEHMCVHTAAIDTGEEGLGFTKNRNEPYGRHPWNLKMFSQHPRNVLRYLGPVLGMTVPTLHLGMLFSTSCWHKDPHALPWMEFHHNGPRRIWYGIPNEQSDNFRKAVETICPTSCQNKALWLSSETAMIPPRILREHNVSLSHSSQEEGEFILAFPKAYTCCISTGYTESESVYFAPPNWLDNLPAVFLEARESCEPTMFSMEQLLFLMGKDPRTEKLLLQKVQPIYDKMLRDEVNNRQMLQERGLKFIHEAATSSRRKCQTSTWNVRDQDECEYCRVTLFLSKVRGLTSRNSSLCLEHALKLLDTDKYQHKNVSQLEVFVYVSVKELNSVGDDMKRRLSSPG